jgi:hypothetical protein
LEFPKDIISKIKQIVKLGICGLELEPSFTQPLKSLKEEDTIKKVKNG